MEFSKQILLGSIAAVALAAPAIAEDRSTAKQKEQYIYQQGQDKNMGAAGDTAIGPTKPSSGPGVQGPPDTRTGPSTHAPGGSADANTGSPAGAESGASTGEGGTQPSQDSSGVQGFPDTRTGPSTKQPGDGAGSGSSTAP